MQLVYRQPDPKGPLRANSQLKVIHDAGGPTVAQEEATSVVYGMPKAAADLGAVDHVLPLERIAAAMIGLARKRE